MARAAAYPHRDPTPDEDEALVEAAWTERPAFWPVLCCFEDTASRARAIRLLHGHLNRSHFLLKPAPDVPLKPRNPARKEAAQTSRGAEYATLHSNGWTVADIARRYSVTRDAVYRGLRVVNAPVGPHRSGYRQTARELTMNQLDQHFHAKLDMVSRTLADYKSNTVSTPMHQVLDGLFQLALLTHHRQEATDKELSKLTPCPTNANEPATAS